MPITLNNGDSQPQAQTSIPSPGISSFGTDNSTLRKLQQVQKTTAALSPVSGLAREYIEKVEDALLKNTPRDEKEIRRIDVGIKGMIAFEQENKAYLVLMDGSVNHRQEEPVSNVIPDGLNHLFAKGKTIVNSITITPEDYTRPDILAMNIINEFMSYNNPELEFNINDIAREQFEISTDLGRARQIIDRSSPHGIASRVDIAAILYLRPQEDRSGPNYVQQQGRDGQTNYAAANEFITVGGYVEFTELQRQQAFQGGYGMGMGGMMQQNGMSQTSYIYQPRVCITEIVGSARNENMIPLGIGLATEAFVRGDAWKQQFIGFAANQPNLGNLISETDEKGNVKPYQIKDIAQFHEFIAFWCTTPVLEIRISEGRSRLPGLTRLIDNSDEAVKSTNKLFNKFFDVEDFGLRAAPASLLAREFTGAVQLTEGRVDSRYVDYLYLAKLGHVAGDPNSPAFQFKYPDKDPYIRAALLKTVVNNQFTPYYVDWRAIMNYQVLVNIMNKSAGKFKFAAGVNVGTGQVSLDQLYGILQEQRLNPLSSLQSVAGLGGVPGTSIANFFGMYGQR